MIEKLSDLIGTKSFLISDLLSLSCLGRWGHSVRSSQLCCSLDVQWSGPIHTLRRQRNNPLGAIFRQQTHIFWDLSGFRTKIIQQIKPRHCLQGLGRAAAGAEQRLLSVACVALFQHGRSDRENAKLKRCLRPITGFIWRATSSTWQPGNAG